jgi:hypothetical protein
MFCCVCGAPLLPVSVKNSAVLPVPMCQVHTDLYWKILERNGRLEKRRGRRVSSRPTVTIGADSAPLELVGQG